MINEILNYDIEDVATALVVNEPYEILSEIADSNVDVYNYDLLRWLPDNYHSFEDAVNAYGFAYDTDGNPDFMKSIMQAQYHQNEVVLETGWEKLRENVQEIMKELPIWTLDDWCTDVKTAVIKQALK